MDSPIRAVFMGSPEFAVPSLEALIECNEIDLSLVITQPDRPAGRGRKLQPPAVKVRAEGSGIRVWQPETLREAEMLELLRQMAPDIVIVVSYGEILRREILDIPKFGCLNVHPSLLPAYRGSLPIQAPILQGDPETGVTVIKMVRRMDAGPIIYQERHPLSGQETTGSLSHTLSHLAAECLSEVIVQWCAGEISEFAQDENLASYTRQITKEDAAIDWNWSSSYIERFVRAMHAWPRAWSTIEGQRLTIDSVEIPSTGEFSAEAPGSLRAMGTQVLVRTGDGHLCLQRVQPAGKKPMDASDWLRGLQRVSDLRLESFEEHRDPLIYTR